MSSIGKRSIAHPFCCDECLKVFEYGLDDMIPTIISSAQYSEIC